MLGSDLQEIVPFRFTLVPAIKPEQLHENIRSSVARNLPIVRRCEAHDFDLSVAGGGPSLEDTYKDLTGYVASINGSLPYLLSKNIVPQMCGVCDPSPHMVDIVEADPRVTYFVASCVHPSVYDKLLGAGCTVYRWNSSSIPGGEELLGEIEPDYLIIGGGSTMGLRWLTLGYTLGFRKFHLHGLDSSFRLNHDRGRASHAYPDHQDEKDWISFDGLPTRPNFIGQVADFIGWMDRLQLRDVEPVSIQVYGDGLLQRKFAEWKARNAGAHEQSGPNAIKLVKPVGRLNVACVQTGNYLGRGAEYVRKLFDACRESLPDAHYVCLTDDPATVPDYAEAKAIPEGLDGWWNKLALFKPGMFPDGERVLSFDLDTLIVGDLKEIASYGGPFAIMRDALKDTGYQSAMMAWEAGKADHIWTLFDNAGRPMTHPAGDQGWIEFVQPGADIWQHTYPGQVVSFKRHCYPRNGIPEGATVCIFHGEPRPHEAAEALPWIAEIWNRNASPKAEAA